MPCGWEGNRRSGVALAMRHGLKWFINLRAHGLDREMSTPPTLSCGVWPIYHLPPIQWIGPGDYVFGLSVRLCVRAYQSKQWVDGSWVNGSNGPVFLDRSYGSWVDALSLITHLHIYRKHVVKATFVVGDN